MDHVEALWNRYLDLEIRGDRAAYLEALESFAQRFETLPSDTRTAWVDAFLRARSRPDAVVRVRTPLFRRVLFPVLKERYVAGDAEACRLLAEFSRQLYRYKEGWADLGHPSELDLWKEAYRRDPGFEAVRSRLVDSIAGFVRYTLHELPIGVLYGTDGATLEQCDDLLAELAFLRELLTPTENERFKDLLERASFHYLNYREYLSDSGKQDYATFLIERGERGDASATERR